MPLSELETSNWRVLQKPKIWKHFKQLMSAVIKFEPKRINIRQRRIRRKCAKEKSGSGIEPRTGPVAEADALPRSYSAGTDRGKKRLFEPSPATLSPTPDFASNFERRLRPKESISGAWEHEIRKCRPEIDQETKLQKNRRE